MCIPAAFKLAKTVFAGNPSAEIFTVSQPVKSSNRVLCMRHDKYLNGQNTPFLPPLYLRLDDVHGGLSCVQE